MPRIRTRFRASHLLLLLIGGVLLPSLARAAIGQVTLTWSDAARSGRAVQADIYYPADTAGGGVPVAGAPGVTYPVVVFGHGFLMTVSTYANIWQALVPAGYIVALPRTEGSLFPNHQAFGLDLAFAGRMLVAAGADPASLFFGRIGGARALAGHSMGGGASFLGAASDPGVDAVVNLAAAETNPSAVAACSTLILPALLFAGSNDCVTPPPQHQLPMFAALASACRTLVTVTGGSHCQFAGFNFNCSLGEGSCTPGPTITRVQQQGTVNRFLIPWLDWQLKGDTLAEQAFRSLLAGATDVTSSQACATSGVAMETLRDSFLRVTANVTSAAPARLVIGLPAAGRIRLAVFDVAGRRRAELLDEERPAGVSEVTWGGRDESGRRLPSGLYFARLLAASGEARVARILLLR